MADCHKSSWDPNIVTKPLLAIEWANNVDIWDFLAGWSRVTFLMQVRMKHRPYQQVWCRWLYFGSTDNNMAMSSYPAEFTLDLSLQEHGIEVFYGGLELEAEWSLAVSIAQVKKRTPSQRACQAYWCISEAIRPKQRRVVSVSCQDFTKQTTVNNHSLVDCICDRVVQSCKLQMLEQTKHKHV